jgi:hypothetical protein
MKSNAISFDPAGGYARVKLVTSFKELVETPWGEGVNALCWSRTLGGDFEEIVAAIGTIDEITGLDEEDLRSLELSSAGRVAREVLIKDLRRLADHGLEPNLDCIPAYPRDDESSPVPIDVYGFHVDSAPVLADTYLCCYTVAASEGVANEDAVCCVDIPEIRTALRQQYGGLDDEGFRDFLTEHFYDLHFVANEGARLFGFGLGNLWRIANACPGSPVPPCIHRAPTTKAGAPPRLLLIS